MKVKELIKQLGDSGSPEATVVVGIEGRNGGIHFLEIAYVTHSDHTGDEMDFPAIINVDSDPFEMVE